MIRMLSVLVQLSRPKLAHSFILYFFHIQSFIFSPLSSLRRLIVVSALLCTTPFYRHQHRYLFFLLHQAVVHCGSISTLSALFFFLLVVYSAACRRIEGTYIHRSISNGSSEKRHRNNFLLLRLSINGDHAFGEHVNWANEVAFPPPSPFSSSSFLLVRFLVHSYCHECIVFLLPIACSPPLPHLD